MNILRTIAKSIPGLVILLIVAQLVWSNTLVVGGKEVRSIDLAIAELRQENERLAAAVASASSLLTVSVKSQDMGFVEPTKGQFVMIGSEILPVALARP
ncbi:MAG: hypothetical protein UY49_C0039G0007 [Microgenomates group bacterium GW2011_GWC1_49_7]|nr:MAG: hypothetical protein UY49_C0039G0007 [Microgenomates group bacterium GW2011_GWC1_49_7]